MAEAPDVVAYLAAIGERFPRTREGTVLAHGRAYAAHQQLPPGFERDQLGACFRNAFHLAQGDPSLTYVEGYAITPTLPFAIHHAWVVGEDGLAVDTTWEPQDLVGAQYFGVPLDIDWTRRQIIERNSYGVLEPGGSLPADAIRLP